MNAPNANPTPVALPPRHRFRLKHLLRGLAILILGIIIGSAATAHFGHHLMMKIMGDPAKMGERLHSRLDRKLDLTPEQSRKIGAIIADHTAKFTEIMRETHPRLLEQFDQMSAEIRQQLTPDQAAKWDTIHDTMKRHFPPPLGPPATAQPPTK